MFWILSRISESTTERFWGTGWAGGLHPGEDTIQRQSGRIWRFWLQKTRAFCVNMILQCAARKSSLVICDPKSELYEKTSEYLRSHGYTVRVFNLVTPAASDSWNCLSEIEGQELMAQLFCDVIIKNTGSERGDHFWDNAELNLLKALVLYVERGYPPEKKNIGEVYRLLSMSSEKS